MKRAVLAAAVLMLSFVAVSAKAQTTYSSPAPFVCDAASLHPVTSFYQFQCRGIKLANSSESVVGSFFLFSNEHVEVALPAIPYPPDLNDSHVTNLDSFTVGNPGTFQFEWQVEDANGTYHTGTASGTWEDFVICGGRGCQYHAPKLLTFTTTAN
jgi:hypothetical protein